jgi:uncharacterized membrane protein YhaH (DUF805 family)
MFILFNMIFAIVAGIADNILGTDFTIGEGSYSVSMGYGWIYLIYLLAIMIPSWAVSIRRLHDVGKSGWFALITLIPLIGGIWLIILMCTDGDQTENTYGPSPKV